MASPIRHRARRALAAVPVALALAATATLAGCSDDGEAAGSATSSAPETTTTTTEAPEPAVVVEVLDPGEQPRRPVRLALEEGATATVAHATDLSIVATSGDRRQRLDPPAVRHLVRYEVTAVDGTTATVTGVIEAVQIDGTDPTESADELDAMVGLEVSYQVDELGRTSDATFDLPDEVPATVQDQLRQLEDQADALSAPLPEAAIGVGARWRATSEQTIGETTTTTVTTFTATEVGDAVLAFDTEVTATSTGGALDGSELRGTGTGSTDLQGMASSWQTTTSGVQTVEVAGPDGPTTVTQTIEIRSSALPSEAL